ncbi:MAG: PKD domain-containing protein [Cyclobacteriaceae bacterium]
MKTLKSLIKKPQILVIALMASIVMVSSCTEDEVTPPEPGTVEATVPEAAVVNVPFTFVDRTREVASREWTFQDGTPATSTDQTVAVTFTTAGEKTIGLKITFANGAEAESSYTVNVSPELSATASATATQSALQFGDNDFRFSVALSAAVIGGADEVLWTIPGGIPETSTELSPTVEMVGYGDVDITLNLKRALDGAEVNITTTVTLEASYSNLFADGLWSFDDESRVGSFQTWDGDLGAPFEEGVVTSVSEGFKGSAIQVTYPGNKGYYGMISRDLWESNAQLASGDIVLFSYYLRVLTEGATVQFSRIVNHLPGWSIEDPSLEEGYQYFANVGPVEGGAPSEWVRISVVDTLSSLNQASASNVFPEIGFAGDAASFLIDEVELIKLGSVTE